MLRDVILPLLLVIGFIEKSLENSAVLLSPQNSVLQLTTGVSVPLITTKKGSVVFSAGYQFNYALPWNLTQFQLSIIPARDIEHFDLNYFYLSVENILESYGWSDGRQCLLRSICELAQTPLSRNGQNVIEEIIHLILTPTEDLSGTINSNHQNSEKLYQAAEVLGKSGGDCATTYFNCTDSPLKSFTKILFF